MKCKQLASWLALVGAFGVGIPGVPGCLWFGNNDGAEGRFCASAVEGGRHCVDASSGPAAAWNDAKAAGSEPIQMWAEWPKKYEIGEVVSSPVLLGAWLDDVQTVLEYVRDTQGNAESYHASLSGELGKKLDRARSVQTSIIWEKSEQPQRRIESLLPSKGNLEVDLIKVEVATDKQSMGDVQIILDTAKLGAAPFAWKYNAFVDDFVAYRATEAAETHAYTLWSHEVSGATLAELNGIDQSIVETAHAAGAKPNALLIAGMKLSAEILQFETTTRESATPHTDFMSTHDVFMPDMSSGALRSIHAMLGYAQQRVSRSDATAKSLLLGSDMRRRALQLLDNAPAPLRATTANALLANASTKFDNAARVRVDALATTSMSHTLGLPYLAERYDEYAAMVQMVPLCNATTSSWREAGCVAMRPKFKDASHYLTVTLPAEIAQGLAAMKNKGVDPIAIEKVQQKLKVGDIKGAALAHDALLSSLEGT